VDPDDLPSDDHDLLTSADGSAFTCPTCGGEVDVVRAVAIDEGEVDNCSDSMEGVYPSVYRRARDAYDAPLPEYYTTTDAIAEFDAVLDVLGEVTFWDLDTDALNSDITGSDEDVSGDAVRTLDPSWRESDSEASVLVFDSGTVWDADTERTLDAVRFVALDSGLIEDPNDPVEGGIFTEAYRRCREEYGSPLPRWDPAAGARNVTPVLPDADELVDTRGIDGVDTDAIDKAREDVEAVVKEEKSAEDPSPSIITSLPATGKTTAAIKTAVDTPTAYLAPRKELQKQALDKADRWDVDASVLPVLSEERARGDILESGVVHVRDCGKDRLRDRWSILSDITGATADADVTPGEIFTEDDEEDDSVELDRATCSTAEGDHGAAWALVVHIARRLGYTPQDIHRNARGLFGGPLPCSEDDCEYGAAWDRVSDPDTSPDLLVGSYVHSHVESVRTSYEHAPGQGASVQRSPRAVVLDEFPGESFTTEYGPEAIDFATWLARSLREDVSDRRDMFDADLFDDEFVREWLRGTVAKDDDPAETSNTDDNDPVEPDSDHSHPGGEAVSSGEDHGSTVDTVRSIITALSRAGDLLDARDSAEEILGEYAGALEELGVAGLFTEFVDGNATGVEVARSLKEHDMSSVDGDLQGIAEWVNRDVVVPIERATKYGAESVDKEVHSLTDTELPIGGDLQAVVESAFEAAREQGDAARERIAAATTALRGGPDGCRQLAAWADDGYAHPDAHHILTGIITPTDTDSDDPDATRIDTDAWAFDPSADEGTVIDVVSTTGNATTIVDRNDHGARIHTPPSRVAGNGDTAPLVGLDATGRGELWSVVLGERVSTTDIFDSVRERRRFLEDALDLRVIQAADEPRYYEGDPATKDTDGDVALLEALADEYAGITAPRQRGDEPTQVGDPAVITTKGVKEVLSEDPRLDDVVDTWDNYGNVTGKNELGENRLAGVLGCQHFGDDAIEKFAALAGESVDTDREQGRGAALGYDSDVADAYLDHMTEDQTMQAILRFARGEDGGATVVARTSALRADLPVVGRAQVVNTWSDTATAVVERARSLGGRFTAGDVHDAVDVGPRQVRRVLGELVDAGYLHREDGGPGRAHTYERIDDPGAGEATLPEREEVVSDSPGRSPSQVYYTTNVRVFGSDCGRKEVSTPPAGRSARAPPAPGAIESVGPPG
jgi:hypothetical protein